MALLLPGDNDSVATMIAGTLRDSAPRRARLDLLRHDSAEAETLEGVLRAGYDLASISCTPHGLLGLPPGEAVLLKHEAAGWRVQAAWPYPADPGRPRWQRLLAWKPLCRDE